jgi:uncharacterized protein (DUF433 family)
MLAQAGRRLQRRNQKCWCSSWQENPLANRARRANVPTMPATSYRYLTSQPGVRSGRTIIEGTRIGVHDVIGLLQNGETMETLIARCFPELTRAQVYECLAYYEDHRGEIDLLVAQQLAPNSP